PPAEDELADEAAIVRAMSVVRRTALAGHEVEPADVTILDPLPPARTATEPDADPAATAVADVVDLRDRGPRHLRPRTAAERAVARLARSEEHTSALPSRENLVCRLLLGNTNPPPPETGRTTP